MELIFSYSLLSLKTDGDSDRLEETSLTEKNGAVWKDHFHEKRS